jgi:signal transduction histidine kinase
MRIPAKLKQTIGWMNNTTERVLIFWSIGFWIVALIVMATTLLTLGQSVMLNEARQRNVQMASIVSRDVSAEISSIIDSTRTFDQHLQQLNDDPVTQATAMLGLRLSSPHYRAIYYFNSDGGLILQLTDSLSALVSMKNVDAIVVRPPIPLKKEITDAYAASKLTSTFISDVYSTPVDYTSILYIAMPVEFATDISPRVIVFEIDLNDIWQKINLATAGKTGITYALSRQGLIIAHPDPQFVGRKISPAVSPVLANYEGFVEYIEPLKNHQVVAAYSPVGGPTGWGIVVEQDRSEVYSSITRTGTLIISIWLILSLIGTALIFFLIRSFTRPIKKLTRTAQNIARTGNLKRTGLEWRSDEIGQLSLAFDQMIDRLEKSEGRLVQAATEERNRLARDLHDAVSQTLFSASLIAEVLPMLWERSPAEGRKRLEEVRQLTRGALAEMRTLLLELRPAALAEAELAPLLKQLAESISGRSRIPVNLTIEGECNLPPDVKIAFYRIAQEALNNVSKHSGAKQAVVSLECTPEKVELSVIDNGQGFDVAANSNKSLGMGIIHERASEIGASLSIQSQIGSGTEVTVIYRRGKTK